MEGSMAQINHVEGEEEYVLLDLDDVCVRADIPANAPYVLSGLDTAKPVLVIGDLKLIGEYQETMGTCYIFSEDGAPTVTCSETKPSETNVLKDKQFLDSKQAPSKQVKPIASLHKILKFKLVSEDQNEMAEGHSTWLPNIIDQRVEWNWKESNVALTVIRLDRSPAPHVFFFMDMLPGWPPHCREAQPFLPDVMGGRKDKDRRWKKELGLYMYEGYNLYYSKKGIPRTNIIATRDTFSVMLLIIDMEEEEEGLEAICMKV